LYITSSEKFVECKFEWIILVSFVVPYALIEFDVKAIEEVAWKGSVRRGGVGFQVGWEGRF
jgi:hypothetical protein